MSICSLSSDQFDSPIPTQIGFRPRKHKIYRPIPVRISIRNNSIINFAKTLPKCTLYNARSLFPKISSLVTDIEERSIDVCFITEVWESITNKKHQMKIEELFEMNGIKYISTPRRKRKRGGGAAIAVKLRDFSISKLNVHIPSRVEAVWGLLKPRESSPGSRPVIVCSFYSPPNMKTNTALINHLTITLQSLLIIHKDADIMICGDRNQIQISTLTAVDHSLRQIVNVATHGAKNLDVACTNLSLYYDPPTTLPPLSPDNPLVARPSDHLGVLISPIDSTERRNKRKKLVKFIRPFPDSLLQEFKLKLGTTDFTCLEDMSVDDAVNCLESTSTQLLTDTFPEKKITIFSDDKPWFNEELRLLKRQRLREYEKHGKSNKYCEMLVQYTSKVNIAINKYKGKLKDQVVTGKRGSAYPAPKRMAARPSDA